jgi:hypothetical protein
MLLRILALLLVGCSVFPALAQSRGGVSGPLVTTERWPRTTNLAEWTRDVMRLEGVEQASETERGKAFFRWLRLFNRMATGGMIQSFEGEYAKERYVLDAHKQLFVYGWGYCDTTSRIAEAAWQEYTGDASSAERVVVQHDNGGYHTMYRLRLDGHWGAFDPRYGYYLIERDAPDARVLDWADVGDDDKIRKNQTYRNRSRPFFEFFGLEWERAFLINPRYFADEPAWNAAGQPVECVFGNRQYERGTRFHDMDFRLAPGMKIERFWDNSARKFYVPAGEHTKREEAFLPAGRFYRVTETMNDGNWPKHDPNYQKAKPYLSTVPRDGGYNEQVAGGRTIGQAWGRLTYQPDLSDARFLEILTADSNLAHSPEAPYLRASDEQAARSATFDFYSPYILVDGMLRGELAGNAAIEMRALRAKANSDADPEVWSPWQTLSQGPGRFAVALGRERFNGSDVSLHGVYHFQVRVKTAAGAASSSTSSGGSGGAAKAGAVSKGSLGAAGLSALQLEAYFENGIMSIPQIFEGRNTVQFTLNDRSRVSGPIEVTYRYQTPAGEREHRQVLRASDLQSNQAVYVLDAPGLLRCNSLTVAY